MKEQTLLNIERKALEFLSEERKNQELTQKELGERAFPDVKNPRLKVNSMYYTKTEGGKGLRLRLGDFCAMCQALGKNPPEELFKLWVENKED